jgi:hypothetical protein
MLIYGGFQGRICKFALVILFIWRVNRAPCNTIKALASPLLLYDLHQQVAWPFAMQDMNLPRDLATTHWVQPMDYWVNEHNPSNPSGPSPSNFESSNASLLRMPSHPRDVNVYKTTLGTAQGSYHGFVERENTSSVNRNAYATDPDRHSSYDGARSSSSSHRDALTTYQNRQNGFVEADNASESSMAMSFSSSEDESSTETEPKPRSKVSESKTNIIQLLNHAADAETTAKQNIEAESANNQAYSAQRSRTQISSWFMLRDRQAAVRDPESATVLFSRGYATQNQQGYCARKRGRVYSRCRGGARAVEGGEHCASVLAYAARLYHSSVTPEVKRLKCYRTLRRDDNWMGELENFAALVERL